LEVCFSDFLIFEGIFSVLLADFIQQALILDILLSIFFQKEQNLVCPFYLGQFFKNILNNILPILNDS